MYFDGLVMRVDELLDTLGYRESPNFLDRRRPGLQTAPDFEHIFRRAEGPPGREGVGLQGVYTLRPFSETGNSGIVPVVYVCRASSERQADDIHRLVWNQDVVPFLIVHTPTGLKLYSGFRHGRSPSGRVDGVLKALTDFNRVADLVEDFHAGSIDSGHIWRKRGKDVTPEHRVDWKLLGNLRTLDRWLCSTGLKKETSHALIGKYVYLHYLRDRNILSERKLQRWGVEASSIFGRGATIEGLRHVVERLDDWLNGSVFPLDFDGRHAPSPEHVSCVAGTFEGDEITELGDRQLSLDFQAYDFSYIPIETLSVVYEQFLHAPDKPENPSRGRQIGAYYTPIPVVNLMISELEARRPLEKGMRVFDPSCGSGAFLVQCYRRLIEKTFPPGSSPKPGDLRELLQETIFGVDVEEDACNVTELSLILTLLDYVHPPDLEGSGQNRFRLPVLRGNNIFRANFFGDLLAHHEPLRQKFDWVVGNPPWKLLSARTLLKEDRPAWTWMQNHDNKSDRPIGNNQLALAFAWHSGQFLRPDGEIALLLPAMTLFSDRAKPFRQAFLGALAVHTVVNFSNMRHVLFRGKSVAPAAAVFFSPRPTADEETLCDSFVRTYSPFVANQESTLSICSPGKNNAWSIVVNASEIRDIPLVVVTDGESLPWKVAMWGSNLDLRLLRKIARRFPTFEETEGDEWIIASEGPKLRPTRIDFGPEKNEYCEEVVGKRVFNVKKLSGTRNIFVIPSDALEENKKLFLRLRGGKKGLAVCRPPHILVGENRRFAIFTNEYAVVPPGQVGIASPTSDTLFLKALTLFLNSEFAYYHQFLASTKHGVERDAATISALRQIPMPVVELSRVALQDWSRLHTQLVRSSQTLLDRADELPLFSQEGNSTSKHVELLAHLNEKVNALLGLDAHERALIHDLVDVRLALNDGQTGKPAVREPKPAELESYAQRLKSELDDFISGELPKRHQVAVVYDALSGMIQVDLVSDSAAARKVTVVKADAAAARQLERTRRRLREQRSQWVYFDRNLRIYEGTRTYVLKPMQRFHWTESQAMIDAREIIAETLDGVGVEG